MREIIANDKRILTSPAPFIELGELAASSVNIKIRVWVNSSDYWNVFFSMNQTVYTILIKKELTSHSHSLLYIKPNVRNL